MQTCETTKVLPSGKEQGEFVEINKSDFDPLKHKLYEAKAEEPQKKHEGKTVKGDRGADR